MVIRDVKPFKTSCIPGRGSFIELTRALSLLIPKGQFHAFDPGSKMRKKRRAISSARIVSRSGINFRFN